MMAMLESEHIMEFI